MATQRPPPATTPISKATDVAEGVIVASFTIRILRMGSLTIRTFAIEGPDAADFAVNIATVLTRRPSQTTTFEITFNPSGGGIRNATLSFINNDGNENPFNFSIRGEGLVPEVAVAGNDVNIADGDASPQYRRSH